MFVCADKAAQSQATFYARGLTSRTGDNAYSTGDRLVYQTPLLKPGDQYNNITGEYTCPTTGVYLFVYAVQGAYIRKSGSHSRGTASLYRGGERVSEAYYSNNNDDNTYLTLSNADIVDCKAEQRVWVQSDWDRNFILGFTKRTAFGGVLLYTT